MINKYILLTLITCTTGTIFADAVIDEKLLTQYHENLFNSKLYCVGSLGLTIILKMLSVTFEQQSMPSQCALLSGSLVLPIATSIYCIIQSNKYWELHKMQYMTKMPLHLF